MHSHTLFYCKVGGIVARFTFPVQGYKGTVQLHWGVSNHAADLFAPIGTPVVAMENGTVTDVGVNSPLGGNNVSYKGDSGLSYYYAHMRDKPLVNAAARIRQGQLLGYVGKTGNAATTDPHLHIGIGYGINSGSGAEGGAGIGFNATEFLQKALAGQDVQELTNTGGPVGADAGYTTGGDGSDEGMGAIPGFALFFAILKGIAGLWGKE